MVSDVRGSFSNAVFGDLEMGKIHFWGFHFIFGNVFGKTKC
jgi:hypothetical protein